MHSFTAGVLLVETLLQAMWTSSPAGSSSATAPGSVLSSSAATAPWKGIPRRWTGMPGCK